ncbi:hypothetical protein C4585_01825 [Candidatus Parcubacteria bacterium]|nr:MAG: hypothetical protein C4585_01825 [Candidatus Parcubacteria bacterium]
MNGKNIVFYLLVFSVLGLVVGYLLTNSYDFGFCFADLTSNTFDVSCHNLFERIGEPLLYGTGALSLIFLLLLFVPQAFPAWKKFAIWFVPLAAIIFIVYPEPGSSDFIAPYPEQVFQWVSALYVLVSLIIIIRNSMK